MRRTRNVPLEVGVRVIADILTLNISLAVAIVSRVLLVQELPSTVLFRTFLRGSLFLSMAGPLIFAMAGFYSKNRAYSGKYKALIIVQACGSLFLAFGLANYLWGQSFSRFTLVATWVVATSLLVGTRLWAWVWQRVSTSEKEAAAAQVVTDERRVLVVGGAGYIGSGLLPRLLSKGYKVRLLDAFIYGEDAIRECIGHRNLEVIKGDFRSAPNLVRGMRGVGTVIHLGAIVGDPACALDEELTIEVNLLATRTIAEVAKAHGVTRFIFASTCSVYGANDALLNERSTLNPVSLYARSKIACERVLLSLAEKDFQPVILRFGTIYGLSGRTRFDLVVNLLAAKAAIEGKITVFGKDQWRPFLHVQDAARAVLAAVEARPEQLSEIIFNVGSDEQNYTLGQIGEVIQSMVPAAQLICTENNLDRRNYRVEFTRIHRALKFTPEYTLEIGVRQVLEAIARGEVRNYKDSKYSNVLFLGDEIGRQSLKTERKWAKELLDVGGPVAGAPLLPFPVAADESALSAASGND